MNASCATRATPPAVAAKPVATANATAGAQHHAMPAHVTHSPTPTPTAAPPAASTFAAVPPKRGHTRSASLENSFVSKNTLGLPPTAVPASPSSSSASNFALPAAHTGTLKSRNEQKRLRNKFGSHSNLEEYAQQGPAMAQGRSKFQNIRQMFEISRKQQQQQQEQHLQMQQQQEQESLSYAKAQAQRPQSYSHPQSQCHAAYQQPCVGQQQEVLQQQQMQLQRKPTPTTGCGSRSSVSDLGLNIIECADGNSNNHNHNAIKSHQQQAQPQQPLPQQQLKQQQQAQPQQQRLIQPQQQRSASGLDHLHSTENLDQATSLLRPIAFKPIPFEPDYSIPNRYCDVVGDRYGSTPSLAPVQGSNLRFGSTTDLRHGGGGGIGGGGVGSLAMGMGIGSVGGGFGGYSSIGSNSSSSYCNSLMARRRGSRSLKINDSMESIRHTPDSDATSHSSTIKSNCSNMMIAAAMSSASAGPGPGTASSNSGSLNSKYQLSEQCDMTPSPSDSGISDLEAALKDRDSELSYLRQTMEHNEKDKEAFWENETKRLKAFYEGQQREYLLKIKKMEQMLAMQQFQFKQNKLRLSESTCKIKEQMSALRNENELLRNSNNCLKNSERNLSDRAAFLEEKLSEAESTVAALKAQLEESEWKVCERNGEIALLKTQLKEANVELTMKEHAIVHLRHENTNSESQIYQSLQESSKVAAQQRQHDEQQQQQKQRETETETELKQLNKIIILKDQVILALTNELAKLRKELSDLAIYQEYGEEPSGKFTRLKHQLDNLTDICNRTRRHATLLGSEGPAAVREKVVDDTNLEVIMNCLKIAPPLAALSCSDQEDEDEVGLKHQQSADQRLAKMSADIQKFVYGAQNLPDVADVINQAKGLKGSLESSTLDTLIEESSNYAEEIAKLRKQLDDVRENFEMEKLQWCEEREKVLSYQKQLQTHYINMYQKLRSLQKTEGQEV